MISFQTKIPLSQYAVVFVTPALLSHSSLATHSLLLRAPSRQINKNAHSLHSLLLSLENIKIQKGQKVLAVGGGSVLDLVGLACSIFKRGIEVDYVPTTLLSMVDAAVGGKTAINLNNKNMAGTIKLPGKIMINSQYLVSLPDRHIKNGLAQAVKTSFLYDSQLLQKIAQLNDWGPEELRPIIRRCCQIKQGVCSRDLNEKGQRKWLNFGHTLGHALQIQCPDLLHGQSVSIGMVFALGLKYKNQAQKLQSILKKIGLPTKIPEAVGPYRLWDHMLNDKKTHLRQVNIYMPEKPGKVDKQPYELKESQFREVMCEHVQIEGCQPSEYVKPAPSSKSLSNRYLFMAAINAIVNPNSCLIIKELLQSQDTQAMLQCMKAIGTLFTIQGDQVRISGWQKQDEGLLNVANSGITARFMIALCSMLKGKWTINCHQRMKERPNKQMFDAISKYASIRYLENQFCLPAVVEGGTAPQSIIVDGRISSQFISAFLLCGSLRDKFELIMEGQQKGKMVSESFVDMTIKCLQESGVNIKINKNVIQICNKISMSGQLTVQEDMASRSYIDAFRSMFGMSSQPFPQKTLQGDAIFNVYLNNLSQQMDFNNCTDTFMTMVCAFPFLSTQIQTIRIKNIGNQRVKQSDRIYAITRALLAFGVPVRTTPDSIQVQKWNPELCDSLVVVNTYNDHRIAMASTIAGAFAKRHLGNKIRVFIRNKTCVNKTFPSFWKHFQNLGLKIKHVSSQEIPISQKEVLLGPRASGKSTLGKIRRQKGESVLDLDQCISELLKQRGFVSMKQFVQKAGWEQFRSVQSQLLFKLKSRYKLIVPGAGILTREESRAIVQNYKETGKTTRLFSKSQDSFDTSSRPKLPVHIDLGQREIQYQHFSNNYEGSERTAPESALVQCSFYEDLMDEAKPRIEQADMVEIRLDKYLQTIQTFPAEKLNSLINRLGVPVILTLRSSFQGGFFSKNYVSALSKLSKFPVSFIDLEYTAFRKTPKNPSRNYLISHHFKVQQSPFLATQISKLGLPFKLVDQHSQDRWINIMHLTQPYKTNRKICYGPSLESRLLSPWKMGRWGKSWPNSIVPSLCSLIKALK